MILICLKENLFKNKKKKIFSQKIGPYFSQIIKRDKFKIPGIKYDQEKCANEQMTGSVCVEKKSLTVEG